jgi:hypothetical protein
VNLIHHGIALPCHQKQNNIGDLFGLYQHRPLQVGARLAGQLGIHTAWANGVDANTVTLNFPGQGFGHTHHGVLRSTVSCLVDVSFDANNGCNVDDKSVFLLLEIWQLSPGVIFLTPILSIDEG